MAYPLDAAAASPRPVKLGGDWWMVRPLPLWGLGMLYAFVRDTGGDPERLDFDALLGPGMPTTLYASLKPCHPAFSFDDAIRLAAGIGDDPAAKLALIDAAFHRAPSQDEPGDDGPTETNWARYLWALARERDYSDAAGLSLDQAHIEFTEGRCGEPRKLTVAEVQKMWEEANPGVVATPAPEVDESVVPEGATQVEMNGITAWELPDNG